MTVRIVTDSTSDIGVNTARRLGITVVPQNVHFRTRTYEDNVSITADQFYSMLATEQELPKTSQASPGRYREVYDQLDEGADGIVSIHISSKLSGTFNSARQGATMTTATCPLEVIDSAQGSMGLGLVAIAAAAAANRGASHEQTVAVARDAAARAQCFTLLETLEYLHRGGRIGKAQALMGSILKVKPMTIIRDGEVHPLGKARTFPKALELVKETARSFAPVESLAVIHSTTSDTARELANDLKGLLPGREEPYIARFGPAVGVYAGPGAIGIALLQSRA